MTPQICLYVKLRLSLNLFQSSSGTLFFKRNYGEHDLC